MHEFIERRTGDTCPCLKGIGCPMLNEQGESPLLMPVPKPRPGHTNSAHAVGLAGMFYSLSPLLKLAGAS